MPVPGPSMIRGVLGSSGRRKSALVGLSVAKIWAPSGAPLRWLEQTPRNRPSPEIAGSSTTPTVMAQRSPSAAAEEEIE